MSDALATATAFLEQHRVQQGRDTLEARLLTDGYAPALVALALAQVYGAALPPAPPKVVDGDIAAVVAYLEAQRLVYDGDTLKHHLLASGVAATTVQLAYAKVHGYQVVRPQWGEAAAPGRAVSMRAVFRIGYGCAVVLFIMFALFVMLRGLDAFRFVF